MTRPALLLGLLVASFLLAPVFAQDSRPAQAPTANPPTPPATTSSESSTSTDSAARPGPSGPANAKKGAKKKPKKEKLRHGIPVDNSLLLARCAGCHTLDSKKQMSRISFMRKSPEGWSTSIKRMVRLYNVQLTPQEAKDMVRYLATNHGLTRDEAKRSLYESERRVHWSEAHHDEDLRNACSKCHTLGRVFAQHRDQREWELLRATHVAYFPLSSRQVGGRPARPQNREQGGGGGGERSSRGRRDRDNAGDRVLKKLATDQPLFTEGWNAWTVNRRAIPLAGEWAVVGHEIGRGDFQGMVTMTQGKDGMFGTRWKLSFANGDRVDRSGRGLLYAGYSWRGRTSLDGTDWREVLLLDADWRRFEGRVFTGDYAETGADVELFRLGGAPRTFALEGRAVPIPSRGHVLTVFGSGMSADMTAADFHLGQGVTVTGVEVVDSLHTRLTIDVADDVEVGERLLSFGLFPGQHKILLYDAVDYVRIVPRQGLARIGGGGGKQPKQLERFELRTMHRGEDGKPFTDDDIEIGYVQDGVRWSLSEFHSRESDDDLAHVGAIDPRTGHFTPGIDGPNPARKWQANNVGEVYVVAEVEMTAPIRAKPVKAAGGDKPKEPATEPKAAPPEIVRKTWRARTPLVVSVPAYVRFQALDWGDDD